MGSDGPCNQKISYYFLPDAEGHGFLSSIRIMGNAARHGFLFSIRARLRLVVNVTVLNSWLTSSPFVKYQRSQIARIEEQETMPRSCLLIKSAVIGEWETMPYSCL